MEKRASADPSWFISTDPELIQAEAVHRLLQGSYWADHRTLEIVRESIANSVCFGVYLEADRRQIGFARVVTDKVTFSWICDVIVDDTYRGRGIGKALMAAVMGHPYVRSTSNFLGTRDAHGLYEKYGFVRRELMRRSTRMFG
jgi:GNAT superfamily N-acetyltransferase